MKSLLLIQDNKNAMTSDYIQKSIGDTENLLKKDVKLPNDENFHKLTNYFTEQNVYLNIRNFELDLSENFLFYSSYNSTIYMIDTRTMGNNLYE
jgi:hypothetical protein